MHRNFSRAMLTGAFMLLAAVAAGAATPHAAAEGQLVNAPNGQGEAELVTLDPAVASALLELAPETSLAVADWPVAPGVRKDVELVRFEVYAPDARIVKIEGNKVVELPRSRLAFFRGHSAEGFDRLIVSIDPDTRRVEGVALTEEGTYELRPGEKSAAGSHLVATKEGLRPEGEAETSWSCGKEQDAQEAAWMNSLFPSSGLQPGAAKAIISLHTATVAVETDNEFMNLKFSNNTTNATNYIANLIARMNIMYERDLLVRLVQGFTILRPSTTPDPYVQGPGVSGCTGCANSAQLNEFGGHWSGGCGGACVGVSRAVAMMLSGKQPTTNSASGIASVNTLCSTSGGYSFTQVFRFAQDTSASDGSLVGHEIGHNFGSHHTHCYSPPADTCYNGESCYTGSTSCPAPATYHGVPGVTGTVMSYCHLTGCGSSEVFHARTNQILDPIIEARVGQCIFALGPPNAIFSNGFETGNASLWQ